MTPARKRAPDGPVKAHSEGETKIPATPSRGLKKPTKVEQPTQSQIPPSAQPPRQGSQPHETQSQGEDEAGADGYESQPESIPQDPNADLPDFDYEHLNADFNAAMAIAGRNETELVDKFHRYAEVFYASSRDPDLILTPRQLLCTWSQAASDRDEQRAFKRSVSNDHIAYYSESSQLTSIVSKLERNT